MDCSTTQFINPCLEAALDIRERNLRPTICDGKKPLGIGWSATSNGNEWGKKVWSPDEMQRAFAVRAPLNVGIQVGPPSMLSQRGVIDIEADSPEEEAAFATLFSGCDVPVTPTFKSKRGKHRLFAWHDRLGNADTDGNGVIYFAGLGCRIGAASKQVHSCVPPSINTDGSRREWLVSLDDAELAPLPEVVVDRLIATSKSKSNGHHKQNGHQAESNTGKIPDGQRDKTLISLGGTMRRVGMTESEIRAALEVVATERCEQSSDFNPQAVAVEKARSVCRYAPSDPAIEHGGQPDVQYQRITAAELDAGDYRTEFLIEGTLVAGQPLIVAGGKKCLKTNILLDAAISLATATPMLGTLKVNRACRVAVMSGESGMATIQETARRICRSKFVNEEALELKNVPGLIFSPDLPRIDDARHQVALAEFLTADEIELVVIDPAYLAMPSEDNGNLFAQGNLLRILTKVCGDVGASLVLCHHTKRTGVDPFQPPELEHIAWAGFQEFARQWWLIGRRERFDPDSDGEHKLWFNIGGSAGFAALWAADITEGKYPAPRRWEVNLNHAAEARKQAVQQQQQAKAAAKGVNHFAAVEAAKGRIADALRSVPGNADTKRGIRERSGLRSGAAFDDAIGYLLRVGKLVACDIERENGHKYEGYRYEYGNG